ncbi:MAG: MmoB/DmpM family protein [Rhodoferax sp.]|nr:MmoB/DmpM family protein [Rhodoferax sp.]MCF8207998.1 MmoB/DmpM family protein [Rhodoferax sp.]
MSNVFIAFQTNEETRCIVDAIVADNPNATVNRQPAMVKIDAPDQLVIRRSSVEEQLGRTFDLQELHINLITLTGHIDETEDEFTLRWAH